MANLTIKTNNQPRDLFCWHDLADKWRAEFDYVADDDQHSPRFVYYKGYWYDVCEFMRTPRDEAARQELNELAEWDGYQSDSFFSGIVLRYVDDFERAILGTYYS